MAIGRDLASARYIINCLGNCLVDILDDMALYDLADVAEDCVAEALEKPNVLDLVNAFMNCGKTTVAAIPKLEALQEKQYDKCAIHCVNSLGQPRP
ncbi:hypothetical protein BGZ51_009389 [Haplosporangium sp. Z 767]|nr:hypothetical protein BGZ51_009389 [Haplosporangium sp. Z 767]